MHSAVHPYHNPLPARCTHYFIRCPPDIPHINVVIPGAIWGAVYSDCDDFYYVWWRKPAREGTKSDTPASAYSLDNVVETKLNEGCSRDHEEGCSEKKMAEEREEKEYSEEKNEGEEENQEEGRGNNTV